MPLRSAWLAAVITAALVTIGMPLELFMSRGQVGLPNWPSILSTLIGFAALVTLVVWRKRATHRIIGLAYAACSASVIFALTKTDLFLAENVTAWVPFQGHKLGGIVGALLAPSFPLGVLTIVAHGAAVVFELAVIRPETRAAMAFGEPMITLIFMLVATLALVFRFGRIDLEQRVTAAETETVAARQFSQTLLYIKDLANTPLQTLDIALTILSGQPDEDKRLKALAAASRAVEDLRDVGSQLARFEKQREWRNDDLSFDARKRLDELQ